MATYRNSPVEMDKDAFARAGHALVDRIADFLETIAGRPVSPPANAGAIRDFVADTPFPESGTDATTLLARATDFLFDRSLHNGHPRFMGYITSSAAPIGALADLLAAAVNPNVGANILSPAATAIEQQAIRWLARFVGVPGFDGLLVSGGNMANLTAFFAGLHAKAPGNTRTDGLSPASKLLVYCPVSTHTWIDKAAVLSGLGTAAVRWIVLDAEGRMDVGVLEATIRADKANGALPVMAVGTAGDVSTGAVDDLKAIAAVCRRNGLWFHIDGAYGMPAALLPELATLFAGAEEADSIALDPHKWLYSPLEAGCVLVKDPNYLIQTYSSHPVYYNFSGGDQADARNFYEYGLQNSRGFRALKVWLGLQQAGESGYREMIREDIAMAEYFFHLATLHPELEAVTRRLSITTLRYIPPYDSGFSAGAVSSSVPGAADPRDAGLNRLNEALLNTLQSGGEVFLSNAMVQEKFCLRSCIVNFRTTKKDIEAIVEIIVREGRRVHAGLSTQV